MQKGVPQVMDITSIRSILHYLSKEILPSKFETAQQPEPNTIQLCFRGLNNQSWIEVSWHGNYARIMGINRPEKIGSESTLSKQLRYGLKYMALISIKQDRFERVIKFEFAKKPGDEISKYLVFELMGKHSNIFYLDKNQKIIALGKQMKLNQSSFRSISTGSIYSEPPSKNKKEPSEEESYDSWKESITKIPESLKDSLINTYQGVSPVLTKQIEVLSELGSYEIMDKNVEIISEVNLKKIYKSWVIWIHRFKTNNFNFSIFDNFFYCVWFPENKAKHSTDLINGIENYYNFHLKQKKIETLITKIDGIIFKQANIEKKNLNMQYDLLTKSENHKLLKEKADLIFAVQEIEKKDVIKGQKLYKKVKKLKRAKQLIEERILIYKNKLERLEEFNAFLENLNSLKDEQLNAKVKLLEEIKDEICSEFNINTNSLKAERKKNSEIESLPIELKTPEGLSIQIGRNMRQNDLISFKFSRKGDLWFHAQETPGSHVVLKSSSKSPSDDDIQVAADISALFSRAKRNFKVPVNIVKIKDLQKITKGGPGCVSFKNFEIIWGNPTRGEEYIKNNLKFSN